jgi:hypothetical protein
MLKYGKFETNNFGVFAMMIAAIGVVSIVENGIVAAVKWRRIRGLEKLANLANSRDGVMTVAEAMSEDYSDAQAEYEEAKDQLVDS